MGNGGEHGGPGRDERTSVDRVVVVGAGLAGLRTVQALRERGYAGSLVLLGAEHHAPYDRPPLSKEVLRGEADTSTLEVDWQALDVDLHLGVRATALRDRVVRTDGGDVAGDAVVVATGATPLQIAGEHALVLRTIEEAMALRAALVAGARVVVVGAGWIGAEVATAAAAAGCDVEVVEAGPAPLSGALPPDVGALTVPWYDAAGVRLRLNATVERVERGEDGLRVRLAGGDALTADVVVEGVGVRPATGWLAGSGVELDDRGAVVTDESLRSSLPGVWAVGDASAWWSRRFGTRMHLEHWDDALHAPDVVAASILGEPDAVHDPVPYFWSEQLGRRLQYAGYHPAGARVVRRGDPEDGAFTLCWLAPTADGDGERLVAVVAVDRPRDLLQGRRLIERGVALDVAAVREPGIALRDATAIRA